MGVVEPVFGMVSCFFPGGFTSRTSDRGLRVPHFCKLRSAAFGTALGRVPKMLLSGTDLCVVWGGVALAAYHVRL